MSDYYTEQLVKRRTTMKGMFIKALMVSLTIVSFVAVFMFPLVIILPVIMIALTVLVFYKLDVEYEYLYVNGDLDIDRITHKSKRKRIFEVNANDIELLAPVNSSELTQHQNAKVYDYSSMNTDARMYALIVIEKGQKKKVIFEPNDTIVEGIWLLSPRKVVK